MKNLSEIPYRPATWGQLREMAEHPIVSQRISDVQNAVSEMDDWDIGFPHALINQVRLEHNEPNAERAIEIAREKYGTTFDQIEAFWSHPDQKMGYTFNQWIASLAWATLVYDGLPLHPSYTLKGKLHSMSLLDTSTVRTIVDGNGLIPRSPSCAYEQVLSGMDRTSMEGRSEKTGFTSDDLAYFIRSPRVHVVYGYSAVEDCLDIPERALKSYCAASKLFDPTGLKGFLENCIQDMTRRYLLVQAA